MSRENTTIRMQPVLKRRTKALAATADKSLSDLIEEALLFTFPELGIEPEEHAAA
jgi:predicted transcriptional regulator